MTEAVSSISLRPGIIYLEVITGDETISETKTLENLDHLDRMGWCLSHLIFGPAFRNTPETRTGILETIQYAPYVFLHTDSAAIEEHVREFCRNRESVLIVSTPEAESVVRTIQSAPKGGSITERLLRDVACIGATRAPAYGTPYDSLTAAGLAMTSVLYDLLIPGKIIDGRLASLCMSAIKLAREARSHKWDNAVDAMKYVDLSVQCHNVNKEKAQAPTGDAKKT